MVSKSPVKCMEARNLMKDVGSFYPESHIVKKACTAAEQACEIAWQLIEEELDKEKQEEA